MERKRENPRYNVLSCRVCDNLLQSINHALGNRTMQDFMHAAIEDCLANERQTRIDKIVRQTKRAMMNFEL